MKGVLLTLLFIGATGYAFSQQQPVISQYQFNQYYFNPAYGGSGELYNFSFLDRSQWSGYRDYNGQSGAPAMQLLTGYMNIDSTGHTMGVLMTRDKAANLTTYQVQLSYAYRVRLSPKSTLSVGFRGGIVTKSIDYDQYIVKHPDDDLIHEGKQSETQPDVTLGIWFDHEKFYAGISMKGIVVQSDFSTLGISSERVMIATAGYRFNLQRQWILEPSVQLTTNANQTSIQASATMEYNSTLWLGAGYRQDDAVSLMVGVAFLQKKLRLHYAFDYSTSNRSAKSSTSHEMMISCRIGKLALKRIAANGKTIRN